MTRIRFLPCLLLLLSPACFSGQLYRCPMDGGGAKYVQKKTSPSCSLVKQAAPPPSQPYIPNMSEYSGPPTVIASPQPVIGISMGGPAPPPPLSLPPPQSTPNSLPPLPPGWMSN